MPTRILTIYFFIVKNNTNYSFSLLKYKTEFFSDFFFKKKVFGFIHQYSADSV